MTKIVLLIACLFLPYLMHAQDTGQIRIGRKLSLYSEVLGENRRIWVYEPDITAAGTDKDKRYPVLYLLDGDAHFYATVGIIQQLSQANGNGVLPEMIVVAVSQNDRFKELAPGLPNASDSNHANAFQRFLSAELIPYVDKHFRTAPYRLLVGHSLGGLTAIHILTHQPAMFKAYIAIDPSMWFGNEVYLKQTLSKLPGQRMDGISLFMGIANTMPKGMKIDEVGSNRSFETQHIRSMMKLDTFLKANTNGLRYAQAFYEKEGHNTVPLISQYDGLRFIFNYYGIDLTEKDFIDGSDRIAQLLKAHYTRVSTAMGYPVAAPRALVHYLGAVAMEKNQFSRAEALFQLNMEAYPHRAEVYDAYADLMATKKDTAAAVDFYNKAIKLNPDPTTVAKLKSLSGQIYFPITIQALQKYQGVYTLEKLKMDVVLTVLNGKLTAKMSGQPMSELLPLAKDQFTVKGKQGYRIRFEMNGNRPLQFISEQPEGVFKAIFKR
jgi:predicted alpha/beta superfamily hydrolase